MITNSEVKSILDRFPKFKDSFIRTGICTEASQGHGQGDQGTRRVCTEIQ